MSSALLVGLQRKLRIAAVAVILVGGSGSLIVVGPVLAGPAHHPNMATYNVSFFTVNGTETGASGSANYLSTVTEHVKINGTNLTFVVFKISYTDQSLSPLTNPSVRATITPPNGTVVNGTTASIPVMSSGTSIILGLPNNIPANATVEASSEAEAIAKAGGDPANATAGSGDWTVDLQVGAAAFGRIRPSGSITFTIAVEVQGYEGKATKV